MFYKYDEVESTRLNVGVRGRLMDRALEMMKEDAIKGYDVHEIYQNTKKLPASKAGKL
jgi:hypothetical protein